MDGARRKHQPRSPAPSQPAELPAPELETNPLTNAQTEPLKPLHGETAHAQDGEPSGNESSANDSVALRAYRRFEERGREHGHDVDDWLAAEGELANPQTE